MVGTVKTLAAAVLLASTASMASAAPAGGIVIIGLANAVPVGNGAAEVAVLTTV
jgi:hypothetical protein